MEEELEKVIEMEKEALESERKRLIEERIKFEEMMKEFHEEEKRRAEESENFSDYASDEGTNIFSLEGFNYLFISRECACQESQVVFAKKKKEYLF